MLADLEQDCPELLVTAHQIELTFQLCIIVYLNCLIICVLSVWDGWFEL